MSKKTLRILSLCSFIILALLSSGNGQKIRFNVQRALPSEDLVYKKQFKAYSIGTFDSKATSDLLRSKNDFSQLELEVEGKSFAFDLHAKDLRSPNFRLTVQDDNGTHDLPRTPNTTYYGYTSKGFYDVRITADDNFFYALIVQPNDEFYIEPAMDIVPGASLQQYVMYWKSDVINTMGKNACGARYAPNYSKENKEDSAPEGLDRSRDLCKVVDIALCDDHLMYIKYGSSIPSVTNQNMAVINNVLTNYDTEFSTDLNFNIVQVFVVTGTDPWTSSTDPGNLLDDFTAWGPSHLSTHDESSLWTNRDFDGDVIGLAWIGGVCTNFKYNVLQDFTSNAPLLRVLQAHEMGHNFDANHDAPNSGFIMAPSVTNTNTWSPASISAINSYITSINCLATCSAPGPPIAAFNADHTDGCVVLTVHFFDQSQNNPTSWLWTFPGGSPGTSTSQNPTVTYSTSGAYNVTLKATNAQGNNTLTKTNYINVGDDPVANFNYTQNGLSVSFHNLSTGATSYSWNFGDGNTSTQTNPTHVYDEDGVYNVKLTAFSDCGNDMITISVPVVTLPFANFRANITEGCDPIEIEFTNLSSSNSTSFHWEFPGGSPPTSTAFEPTVVYEIPGTFNVTLTVVNGAGDDVLTKTNYITVFPEPTSAFTSAVNGFQVTFNSTGSVGDNYMWNFGDGQTSTIHNPTHVYTAGGNYTVTLTVSNLCGSVVHTSAVSIAGAPVAGFSSDVESGCAPFVVHYFNQSMGNVTFISWIFQGGSPATSNQPNPIVTYNTPGTYDVTLTVSNTAGSDDLFMNNYITVYDETISNFSFTTIGNLAEFDNLSAFSTGSTWDFGDGNTSTATNPSHIYNADGTYTVTLISTGNCGSDTITHVVTIITPPNANFSFHQNGDCAPVTVQYTNLSSPNTTSVNWTFYGGTPATSTQLNPLVTYTTPGTYDTRLIAHSANGVDTFLLSGIVTVGVQAVSSFLISTSGNTVNMENQSTGADTYLWLFGDGNTSTEISPTHTYDSFGTYTISLISTNNCGDDTMSIVIVLSTVPNAAFNYDVHSGCAPMAVQFFDQSQNGPTSWLWTFTGGSPETSTLQNPIVTYNTPGNYTVSLRVENGQGADVLILMDLINVAGTPDATFDHTVNGDFVTLFYPGIDYDSIRWDFGDGRTDTSLNPTVQYDASGQYLITLTVFNACGIDTESVLVTIESSSTNNPTENTSNWQIRPNPFKEKFTLYGEPHESGSMRIALLDVNGKFISVQNWNYSAGSSSLELSADELPSGVIFVQLQDGVAPIVLKAVHLQ